MTHFTPTPGDREPPLTKRGKNAGTDLGLQLDGTLWQATGAED